MRNYLEAYKNQTITFWALNIFMFLIIVIPKEFNTIFNIIPTRLFLTFLLFGIFLLDLYRKKIELNKYSLTCYLVFGGLFFLAVIPSVLVSQDRIISLYTVAKFIGFYLVAFIFTKVKLNKEQVMIILKTLLFAALVVAIFGIAQYVFDFNLHIASNEKYGGIRGRISSSLFNPIYLGVFVNLVFIIVLYMLKEKKINKIFGILLAILLYANLVLTYTRSASLVILTTLILILIFYRKLILNRNCLFILIGCVSLHMVIPGANILVRDAMQNASGMISFSGIREWFNPTPPSTSGGGSSGSSGRPSNQTPRPPSTGIDYSIHHRSEFSRIALQIFRDNKFTGVGFGTYIDFMNSEQFDIDYPDYSFSKTHPHSSPVLLLAETGIIATLLYFASLLSFFIIIAINFFKNFKSKNLIYQTSLIILVISLGFGVTAIIAENLIYDSQIYTIFWIIVGVLINLMLTHKHNKTAD